jgi:hypothetical protein
MKFEMYFGSAGDARRAAADLRSHAGSATGGAAEG